MIEEVAVARRRGPDPKEQALRASRTLNLRPQAVRDEQFAASEFFDPRDLVQVKYEMLRRARVDGTAVARAASLFGFSRPSFYQAQAALERDGLAGLMPGKPGPRRAHKLTEEIVDFARAQRQADPSVSSAALVVAIADRFAVVVHPRSVERALARTKEPKSGGRQ